jgi:hypothetical protein
MAQETRSMIIIWLGSVIIISLFFILTNLQKNTELNAAFAFSILFLGSLVFLMLVMFMELVFKHNTTLVKFWTADVAKNNIKWLGFGVLGVFLVSALAGFFNSPFVGIAASGLVMVYIFWKTRSILISIFSHGIYNSVVLGLGSAGIFTNSVIHSFFNIPIPTIGVNLPNLAGFYSEVIWQFTLVATAEEFLKLATFTWAIFIIKGVFNIKSKAADVIAFIVAVITWVTYHSLQSIPAS